MTRILIALTSHDKLGTTGARTGAYLAEIAHPWEVFTKAGLELDFVSTAGGAVPLDGLDGKDPVCAAFLGHAATIAKLHASQKPSDVDPSRYAVMFYAGGHGTMWDFP